MTPRTFGETEADNDFAVMREMAVEINQYENYARRRDMTSIHALNDQRMSEMYRAVIDVTGDPRPTVGITFRGTTGSANVRVRWKTEGKEREFLAEMTPDQSLAAMGDDVAYVAWATAMLDRLKQAQADAAEPLPPIGFTDRMKRGLDTIMAMVTKRRLDIEL